MLARHFVSRNCRGGFEKQIRKTSHSADKLTALKKKSDKDGSLTKPNLKSRNIHLKKLTMPKL